MKLRNKKEGCELNFGDVKIGQLFIDTEGSLCQKHAPKIYSVIADNNGELYCDHVFCNNNFMIIKKIIPMVNLNFRRKKMAKTYIGSGKVNEKYDSIVDVTIPMDDLRELAKQKFQFKNKEYVKFAVARKKTVDEFGKTHSVYFWTPDKTQSVQQEIKQDVFQDDDIPF